MKHKKIKSSFLGAILGDAMGVPVEFKTREELDKKPVRDMIGYGTYNQPPGTWSDDSSMLLITAESLTKHSYNPKELMISFCAWAFNAYLTPYGKTFSIGNTTSASCKKYKLKQDIKTCGQDDEHSNGNGSLMRILPVSIYFSKESEKIIKERNFEVSGLTHNHIRSKLACFLFSLIVKELLEGKNLYEALSNANRHIAPYIPKEEIKYFSRIINFEILQLPRNTIKSSGYVIDTLEASLWCLFNSNNYLEAVYKAINLGNDTDTTACVTGALAGMIFGIESVSSKLIKGLAKYNKVENIIDNFIGIVIPQYLYYFKLDYS